MPEGSKWREIYSNCDLVMLFCPLALFCIGVATVYSASASGSGLSSFMVRQIIWGVISAFFYAVTLRVGYKNVLAAAVPIFVATVSVLIILVLVGKATKGAVSWFSLGFARIQPSEFGKVSFALMLAHSCVAAPPTTKKGILCAFGVAFFIVAPIMLQPDLGSTMVYLVMMFAVLFVAGASYKILAQITILGFASVPFLWTRLKPYQRMRVHVFFDPWIDPQGAGYNVIQSRIAVGSGGLFGKGFLRGTQGKLHFLPEPHTDFIFSVFSEEFGFIGCLIVLLLFTLLLWRIISVAKYTRDMKAKLLAVAVGAWIWFQMTESVAMSMGLAPVTGLPLPLFSYGGSSLLSVTIGLALVQSIAIKSREDRF